MAQFRTYIIGSIRSRFPSLDEMKFSFRLWHSISINEDTCLRLHYHVHLTKYCSTNNEEQIFYCVSECFVQWVLFFSNEFNRKYMCAGFPSHYYHIFHSMRTLTQSGDALMVASCLYLCECVPYAFNVVWYIQYTFESMFLSVPLSLKFI